MNRAMTNAMQARLDNFDSIHFDALVALARGIANALVGLHSLDARAAQRAGMQIDVAGTGVRHHKAETLLVVEELDLAFDHRAGRRVVVAIAAAPATAAKAIATAAKAVAAAEPVAAAAEIAARAARGGRLRRRKIDAVDIDHLKATLGIRQIADDGGALRHFAMPDRLQGRCVAKGVAAIVQGYEPIALGRVEPFHLARRGSLREGL